MIRHPSLLPRQTSPATGPPRLPLQPVHHLPLRLSSTPPKPHRASAAQNPEPHWPEAQPVLLGRNSALQSQTTARLTASRPQHCQTPPHCTPVPPRSPLPRMSSLPPLPPRPRGLCPLLQGQFRWHLPWEACSDRTPSRDRPASPGPDQVSPGAVTATLLPLIPFQVSL